MYEHLLRWIIVVDLKKTVIHKCHISYLDLPVRCLEKVKKIFSQMVVKTW